MVGSMPDQQQRAGRDGADYHAGQESSQYANSAIPDFASMGLGLPELTLDETNELNQLIAGYEKERSVTNESNGNPRAVAGTAFGEGRGGSGGDGEEGRRSHGGGEGQTSTMSSMGGSHSWGSRSYSALPVAPAAAPGSHSSYTVRHPSMTSLQRAPQHSLRGFCRGGRLAYTSSYSSRGSPTLRGSYGGRLAHPPSYPSRGSPAYPSSVAYPDSTTRDSSLADHCSSLSLSPHDPTPPSTYTTSVVDDITRNNNNFDPLGDCGRKTPSASRLQNPPPTMKHSQNFLLPFTPPHQTDLYSRNHSSPLPTTLNQQYSSYSQHPHQNQQLQFNMLPSLRPSVQQEQSASSMNDWYNTVPEPAPGPLNPPITPMRGTQYLPGLDAMHPVAAQYFMYIATKRWQSSQYAQNTIPAFASMGLPELTLDETNELNQLIQRYDQEQSVTDASSGNPRAVAGTDGATDHSVQSSIAASGAASLADWTNCQSCGTSYWVSHVPNFCSGCGVGIAAQRNNNEDHQAAAVPDAYNPSLAGPPGTNPALRPYETPEQALARQEYAWNNYAWFTVFRTKYPPRRRFTANQTWSRRDCRILAIIETKWEGTKWEEMAAQFCNATGRLVDPEHLKFKMEHDGEPLPSDDDGDYISGADEESESEYESTSSDEDEDEEGDEE